MRDWLNIELSKIIREIKMHGDSYTILRDTLDEYGEPTGEQEEIVTLCGIFHISKGYVSRTVTDATITHTKGSPMILIKFEDIALIKKGDYVIINNRRYNIIEINNIQEYNIVADISLEVVIE